MKLQGNMRATLGGRKNTRELIEARAELLTRIRQFFSARQIIEVNTPILQATAVGHPDIDHFAFCPNDADASQGYFLQSSPECSMKQLLAEGSGAIFQICRAFRRGESSIRHSFEFSMLEWYRVDFSLLDLMNEVDEFLQLVVGASEARRVPYRSAFEDRFGINPFTESIDTLRTTASRLLGNSELDRCDDRDTLLEAMFEKGVEPALGSEGPDFVFHYPPGQASLAKTSSASLQHALRFEVFISGLEIANGCEELTDPVEIRRRLEADNRHRERGGRPQIPMPVALLRADPRLPDCAGVAVGIDRLMMSWLELNDIDETLPIKPGTS